MSFRRAVLTVSLLYLALQGGAQAASSAAVQPLALHIGEVRLQRQAGAPAYHIVPHPAALPNSGGAVRYARLANETWYNEEVTCVRPSPDGQLVAVGGYLRRTSLLGRMPRRQYGSRVHVVDLVTHRELVALETAPVAERTREEKGGSRILDCLFVGNSRYLAAVTNSKLFLWDTEHGRVLGELYFDRALETARLEFGLQGEQRFLAVISGRRKQVYQLVPD